MRALIEAVKAKTDAQLVLAFIDLFQYSDAIQAIRTDPGKLTGRVVAECIWEAGYEREPYDKFKMFEPLAKKLGVDLRKEYDEGKRANT